MHHKRLPILMLIFVICVGMFMLAGCGGGKEDPAQTGGDQPKADPIILKVAHHEPATSPFNKAWEQFAADLEAKTNGACKLELYPGEQLGKGADMVSMVANGITDIGWVVGAFFPGQFPVTEVLNLPLLGIPSSQVGAKSLWDMYQATPQMQEEWSKGMHLITFSASGYQFLNTKTKQITVPADVKGMKIRVAGSNPSKIIEILGGSPVSMPPPDMYEALDKGVIDGYSLDWMGMRSFNLQDVTKYAMNMPFVSVPHGIVMNQKKWDSLPDEVKAVFDELGGAAGTQLFGAAFDSSDTPISEAFTQLEGRTITEVTDEQKVQWQDAAQPVWEGWVKTMTDKGYEGQKLLDTFRGFVEKNAQEIPKL